MSEYIANNVTHRNLDTGHTALLVEENAQTEVPGFAIGVVEIVPDGCFELLIVSLRRVAWHLEETEPMEWVGEYAVGHWNSMRT